MTPHEINQLDGILSAARLLRLAAMGYARDNCNGFVERLDPAGFKLDAYSLGLLDILSTSCGTDRHVLRLLVYLLMLCEQGPGTETIDAAERMLKSRDQAGADRYVEMGRFDMLRLQAGEPMESQSYASLLLAERASH